MAKPSSDAHYDVGYGKPPADSQFTKGRSGNPKGRPKRKPDAQSEHLPIDTARQILADANQPLKVRTADGEASISSLSAVIQATKAKALKGHAPSQKIYLDAVGRAEVSDNERWQRECEMVNRLKERHRFIVADIERQRLADPTFDPPFIAHPDDIELNYETRGIEFRGPWDWDTYRGMRGILELRTEMLFALVDWDSISCQLELRHYIDDRIAARWNAMHCYSRFLPARFALGPLSDYVTTVPHVDPNVGDTIIFGTISPVPVWIARMFQADPAAEQAFFHGRNFLSGSGMILDRYSRYWRPIPGLAMTYESRLRVETKLGRATNVEAQRRALREISRDTTLAAYVRFNAQSSLLSSDRRGADWILEDFRKSLF